MTSSSPTTRAGTRFDISLTECTVLVHTGLSPPDLDIVHCTTDLPSLLQRMRACVYVCVRVLLASTGPGRVDLMMLHFHPSAVSQFDFRCTPL